MKVVLELEYDGSKFSGWQRQLNARSVEEVLSDALRTYLQASCRKQGIDPCEVPPLRASGRTDAGVHAAGQVVSFRWPEQVALEERRLFAALNGITPRELAILRVSRAADSFDARFSAISKCYQYRIFNRPSPPANSSYPAWHIPQRLRWLEMRQAAEAYLGTHDFSAFCARDGSHKTTTRQIFSSELTRVNRDELVYTVVGSGFLKQMVRIMVGTLAEVGLARLEPSHVVELLRSAQRVEAGRTAPPQGLSLQWVRYE